MGTMQPTYTPDWESLEKYPEEKEWLKDAKFGIYTHWGPSTYPISGCPVVAGWYPRRMYETSFSKGRVFAYHKETFGDQHEVGYKDLIPLFKAEHFDADEWAETFKQAGARFAGPVAVHHDNFCMWNSACTEWDSVDKGPKRDICGELAKAVRKRGMRFIVSMHHAGTWNYYVQAYKFDAADPKYAGLYAEPHKRGDPATQVFLDLWFAKVREVIDQYSPDIVYFDACMGVVPEEYKLKMVAYCYNKAVQRNQDFVLTYKRGNLRKGTALIDHEVHYPRKKTEHFWMTDWSLTHWFPNKLSTYETGATVIHRLADIVSKNGALLLNVPPTHDGRINSESRKALKEIGDWLRVNGEAIYNTRPWRIFGTGPNLIAKIRPIWMGGSARSIFGAQDMRFTQSKDGKTVYVIVLGWPAEGKVTIEALALDGDRIKAVSLLGSEETIEWESAADGLTVRLPETAPCKNAISLKVSMD